MLRAALAAALAALDMIRTGPLTGAGEAEVDDDEVAERGVWLAVEVMESSKFAIAAVESALLACGIRMPTGFLTESDVDAVLSRASSDVLDTRDIMFEFVEPSSSLAGAKAAIRTGGL